MSQGQSNAGADCRFVARRTRRLSLPAGPGIGVHLPQPPSAPNGATDPEQTSAPCWISMSRTQQLFDVCRTPQVRQ